MSFSYDNFKVAVFSDSAKINIPEVKKYGSYGNILGNWLQHVRPAAPYKVSELFVEHGYQSTVFNYMSIWAQDDLLDVLEKYSEGKPLLCAFSLTLNTGDIYIDEIKNFIKKIKQRCPGSIAIVGGIRPNFNTEKYQIGDVMYKGRSMDLLMKSIHDRMFDNLIGKQFDTIVIGHENDKNLMDDPVVHNFYDQDLWSETDVGMFETSIGCKFNCTFCNYDFRNVKNPKTASIDRLTKFFADANDRGVTHFFAADDTINETDDKIEIIHTAVKESGITPSIAAFARQDIMCAKPKQIELMSEAGLTNLFFGIESFNYNANKLIRKGAKGEKIIENLKNIKSINPEFFLHGGNILGLTGDNKDSIKKYIDICFKNELLDTLNTITLILRNYGEMHMWEFQSELDTYPEKYGYKVYPQDGKTTVNWSNDWTDSNEMDEFHYFLTNYMTETYGLQSQMGVWSFVCLKALGVLPSVKTFKEDFATNIGVKMSHSFQNSPVESACKKYIKNKKSYYGI